MGLISRVLTGTILTTVLIGTSTFILVKQFEDANQSDIHSVKYMEENPSVEQFIGSISETARDLAVENDLYASVMIAQATLESQHGQSGLSAAPNYNLFGIKGQYNNKSVTLKTLEDDGTGAKTATNAAFRKYPSYEASLKDYASLLRNGLSWNHNYYAGVFKSHTKSYKDATKKLTGTYATDTDYNMKLNQLIAKYDLTQYDQPVSNKKTVKVQNGDSINRIAEIYNVKVTSIRQWNQLNSNNLEEGQRLKIYQ